MQYRVEGGMYIMTKMKKERVTKKIHYLENNLIDALAHPEDGEQRRRYLKRFIYGEEQVKRDTAQI